LPSADVGFAIRPVLDRIDPDLTAHFRETVVGDFDGKGAGAGDNRVAFARGNEQFTVVVNRVAPGWIYDFDHAVAGDFNGDGRDDLFFHNVGEGDNRFIFAGSNETFQPPNDAVKFAPGLINGYARLAVGDFDNNGLDDLFFWAMLTGANRIHYCTAPYQFRYEVNPIGPGAINGATEEIARVLVGQFDTQPGADMLFRHPYTGETRFAFRRGSGFAIVDNRLPFLRNYIDAAAGDVDGDGVDDVFMRNPENGRNALALGRRDGSETFDTAYDVLEPEAARGYHRSFLGRFDGDRRHDLLSLDVDTGGNLLGLVREREFINIVNGVAVIRGTGGADDLRINDFQAEGKYAVSLNGVTSKVGRSLVTRFEIRLGGGNDHVENKTWVPALILGGEGNDTLEGGWADDSIWGEAGDDRLTGEKGHDRLCGGPGNDLLEGGLDNDTYLFPNPDAAEADTVFERANEGTDTLDFSDCLSAATVDLASTTVVAGVARLRVYANGLTLENVVGGAADDTIKGNAASNTLDGGAGNDNLYGGAGKDTLLGGLGLDGLCGGSAVDALWGGPGADRFLLQDADKLPDFVQSLVASDAKLTFKNSSSWSWTDEEVIGVDEALRMLHLKVASTRLLRLANGGAVKFVRVKAFDKPKTLGRNDSSGTIRVATLAFKEGLTTTILHEIGHNWDSENPRWKQFLSLSGWTTVWAPGLTRSVDSDRGVWYYRSNASFASWRVEHPVTEQPTEYGRWNPYEDFATTFDAYFRGIDRNVIPNKLDLIDAWLRS
jgi:Ca2+-binding RTX toxin-like protein